MTLQTPNVAPAPLPRALRAPYAYERRIETQRRAKRWEFTVGLMVFATTLAWASFIPVLAYLEMIP